MFSSKKCKRCDGKLKDSFDFCPFCGLDVKDPEKDLRDFGMLGKGNNIEGYPMIGGGGLGITDKLIGSIFNNLMKSMEKQMRNLNMDVEPEIQTMPNGIRISVGAPKKTEKKPKKQERIITEEQLKRMSKMPRSEAKTNVRRFSDKVVYELNASGIQNVNDVFVSRLENGYEVKAIGSKKVYINSIPVSLPLKSYRVTDKGISLEFGIE